jgi:hypothetical protein
MKKSTVFYPPVIPVPADYKVRKFSLEIGCPGPEGFVFLFFLHSYHLLDPRPYSKNESPGMKIQDLLSFEVFMNGLCSLPSSPIE